MNIALEKCEEYVNGKLRRSYGDAFVRGNNGTKISWCSRKHMAGMCDADEWISATPSPLHLCGLIANLLP